MPTFNDCLKDALRKAGADPALAKRLAARARTLAQTAIDGGAPPLAAERRAWEQVVAEAEITARERKKRRAKTVELLAEYQHRLDQADDLPPTSVLVGDKRDRTGGVAYARAAISLIDADPRFPGISFTSIRESARGLLLSKFSASLQQYGKGAFGRQRGRAHLPNVVYELFGNRTGDAGAHLLAKAYTEASDLGVELFNAAGGSLLKRTDFRLAQRQSPVRLIKAGQARWIEVHRDALDWQAMRWPDGARIAPEDRERVLETVYRTLSTDGASTLDVQRQGGRPVAGSAVGNALERHRFLVYKDADSWLRMHEEFGEGTVFDALVAHLEGMANQIAQISVFGPAPDTGKTLLAGLVRQRAAQRGGQAVLAAEAELKNTFDPMWEVALGRNAVSPDSLTAKSVLTATNLLVSAQLGSAALLAIPGDFVTTAFVRKLNGMNLFGGVRHYLRSFLPGRIGATEQALAAQSGFVMDNVVSSVVAAQRFMGHEALGPVLARRLSDVNMRMSLLAGHTHAARWAVQSEFMGLLARSAQTDFEALPFLDVLRRYGISREDWNTIRNLQPFEPALGVQLLRPIDLLRTDRPNAIPLFYRFQGMISEEAKKMVPESTLEGSIRLKDTTRPDTLAGAVLYSFAMYKNFPISFALIYGRLVLSLKPRLGRASTLAALAASMMLVGAVGTQLREVSKGRDPLPMDALSFYAKALLAGGGLTLLGDFLFGNINQRGFSPQQMVSGPLGGLAADVSQLAFGDVFKWAESVGSLSDPEFESSAAAKAVAFARKYTPGSTLW